MWIEDYGIVLRCSIGGSSERCSEVDALFEIWQQLVKGVGVVTDGIGPFLISVFCTPRIILERQVVECDGSVERDLPVIPEGIATATASKSLTLGVEGLTPAGSLSMG